MASANRERAGIGISRRAFLRSLGAFVGTAAGIAWDEVLEEGLKTLPHKPPFINRNALEVAMPEIAKITKPANSNLVADNISTAPSLIESYEPVRKPTIVPPAVSFTPTPETTISPLVPADKDERIEKRPILNERYLPTIWRNTVALRTEYAKKNPDHLNRIDKDLNEKRINGVVLGIGSEGFLTDVILIWSYDIKSNTLSFISVPRDLQSPEVLKLTKNPASSRINQAVHEAEIRDPSKRFETIREALENFSGLSMDYMDLINFDVFTALIDRTVGKVPIKIDQDIVNRQVFHRYDEWGNRIPDPFYITAGMHEVDGATLLKIVRNRERSSDYIRIYYQQQASEAFLETFFAKAFSENSISEASGMISAFFYTLMENRIRDRMKSNYDLTAVIPDFTTLMGVPESLWEGLFGSGIKLAEKPKLRKLKIDDKNFVVPAGITGVAQTKIKGGNPYTNDPKKDYWLTREPIKNYLTQ